jgi:nucleotide-binding universal stress UspA family protein
MGFKRWGTANAQPTFRGQNSLEDAKDLLKFEVGDPSVTGVAEAKQNTTVYRLHISDIDHPDARLIAAAPDLLEACQTLATLLDTDDWIYQVDRAVKQAQAAIAKVRGEAGIPITELVQSVTGGHPADQVTGPALGGDPE